MYLQNQLIRNIHILIYICRIVLKLRAKFEEVDLRGKTRGARDRILSH